MARTNTYDIGDLVRVTAEFRNLAGALANPDTVTATVRKPDGTTNTPDIQTNGTGKRYVDVDTTDGPHGTWTVRIEATGALQAAEEHAFTVRDSQFD